MRKFLIAILIIFFSSFSIAQTIGDLDTPYSTGGWDAPATFTPFYGLPVYTLLSNPGGWININQRMVDSLFNELIVYTDTMQLVIQNDTLMLAPHIAAAIDTNFSPKWFDLDPTVADSVPYNEGRVFFDSSKYALSYYVKEADVTMNLGQEQWLILYNATASTITNGTPVRSAAGSFGIWGTMRPADASHDSSSSVVGLVTHDVEPNSLGIITRFGSLSDVVTTGLSAGLMYLKEGGGITTTKPSAPANAITLGAVTIPGIAAGELFAVIERFNPVNGMAYVGAGGDAAGASELIALTLNVPVQITNATDNLLTYNTDIGHDITLSGDTLFYAEPGVYTLDISVSFEGDAGGIYLFQIKDNGTIITKSASRRETSNNDTGSASFNCTIKIENANDYATLWVTNINDNTDITIEDVCITTIQVR